ncbi:hypothetical protein BB561_002280 [Smittium simulii]|uniref:ELYS-like domain-containing protein n=1 Tax=Smittium simulii TaxID=133385 RepID=A0A2T9YR22_9FUNG|nr:hypothetical protein BB561_002280 [Smittium simulii]
MKTAKYTQIKDSSVGTGYVQLAATFDQQETFYTFTFDKQQLRIYVDSLSFPDTDNTLLTCLDPLFFLPDSINSEFAFVKDAIINHQPSLIVVLRFSEPLSATSQNSCFEDQKYYAFFRYSIFSQTVEHLGFELLDVTNTSVVGPFYSKSKDYQKYEETWIIYAVTAERKIMAMPISFTKNNAACFDQNNVLSMTACVYSNQDISSILVVNTDTDLVLVFYFTSNPSSSLQLKSLLSTNLSNYFSISSLIYLLNDPKKSAAPHKNDILPKSRNCSKFYVLTCYSKCNFESNDIANYNSALVLFELDIPKDYNDSWSSSVLTSSLDNNNLQNMDIVSKEFYNNLQNIDIVSKESYNNKSCLEFVTTSCNAESTNKSRDLVHHLTLWSLKENTLYQSKRFSFKLDLNDFAVAHFITKNLKKVHILTQKNSTLNFENPFDIDAPKINTVITCNNFASNYADMVASMFGGLEKCDLWSARVAKNRKTLSSDLFIDRMLAAVGIENGHKLYPPTTQDGLKQLIKLILLSDLDILKSNSLLYYSVLDYNTLGDTPEIVAEFVNINQLPHHFQLLVRGYWCLDNGQVSVGLHYLSDLSVDADWAQEIIQVAVMFKCYKSAKHFLDVVRPNIDMYGSSALIFMDIYLNTSVEDAFWFQRSISENNFGNGELLKTLLDAIFQFCIALVSRSQLEVLDLLKKTSDIFDSEEEFFGQSVKEFNAKWIGSEIFKVVYPQKKENEQESSYSNQTEMNPTQAGNKSKTNNEYISNNNEQTGNKTKTNDEYISNSNLHGVNGLLMETEADANLRTRQLLTPKSQKKKSVVLTPHQTLLKAFISRNIGATPYYNGNNNNQNSRISSSNNSDKESNTPPNLSASLGYKKEHSNSILTHPRIPSPSVWKMGRTPMKISNEATETVFWKLKNSIEGGPKDAGGIFTNHGEQFNKVRDYQMHAKNKKSVSPTDGISVARKRNRKKL